LRGKKGTMKDEKGGTVDWATREATKDLRKEEEAARAREKGERDVCLKEKGGVELFTQLHAWMEQQVNAYHEEIKKRAFEVGKIELFGGPGYHHFFEVSSTNRDRFPMKISYYPSVPQRITVTKYGDIPKDFFLAVGDEGNLFFETPKGQPKTIGELGSELLDLFKSSAI
jgi:hypothetical protein